MSNFLSKFMRYVASDSAADKTALMQGIVQFIMNLGIHTGHKPSDTAPAIRSYILGTRKGTTILNRSISVIQIASVLPLVTEIIKNNGHILLVATRPDVAVMMKGMFAGKPIYDLDIRNSNQVSLVTTRLLGGLLTNFKQFGKLMNITKNKPVRLLSASKIRRYKLHRKGREPRVMNKSLPSLIIFFHPNEHSVGLTEAGLCGIPTVGIVDSNCNVLNKLTYAIPGNDEGLKSQFFYMEVLKHIRDLAWILKVKGKDLPLKDIIKDFLNKSIRDQKYKLDIKPLSVQDLVNEEKASNTNSNRMKETSEKEGLRESKNRNTSEGRSKMMKDEVKSNLMTDDMKQESNSKVGTIKGMSRKVEKENTKSKSNQSLIKNERSSEKKSNDGKKEVTSNVKSSRDTKDDVNSKVNKEVITKGDKKVSKKLVGAKIAVTGDKKPSKLNLESESNKVLDTKGDTNKEKK